MTASAEPHVGRDPVALVRARLEALGRRIVGSRADAFTAQCPAHDDRTPSLTISCGEDGRALIHCHAGCDLDAVLIALGLDLPDLFVGPPPSVTRTRSRLNVGSEGAPCNTPGRGERPELHDLLDAYARGELEPAQVVLGDLPTRANEGPCNTPEGRERPELHDLLDAYEGGQLEPAHVLLGDLPDRASVDDRRVADDLRLLIGLRRADGELRPLPYSTRFCAARMGWGAGGHVRAGRVLRRLERWGVIDGAGELQRRGGMPRGTKTYEAPLRVEPTAVESAPVPVEVQVEPSVEVAQEPRVNRAEAAGHEHAWMVTAGDRTTPRYGPVASSAGATLDLVHGPNDNAGAGVIWVGDAVVGRYVWDFDAVTANGERMPF